MVVVGTKTSPEARARLDNIAEKLGCSIYDIIQIVIDVVIRMFDDRFNLSVEMEKMVALFDGVRNWDRCIRITDREEDMNISEAIYFLTEPGRTGTKVMLVQGDSSDMLRTSTWNTKDIVARFMELGLTKEYEDMKKIGDQLGTTDIFDTLISMIIYCKEHLGLDVDMTDGGFDGNDWCENGRRMAAAPFKRTMTRNVEQTTLDFG